MAKREGEEMSTYVAIKPAKAHSGYTRGLRKNETDLSVFRRRSTQSKNRAVSSSVLDRFIREWAAYILREIEYTGLPNESICYKMWRYGPDGMLSATGIIPVLNHWPRESVRQIHDAIFSLPVKFRNYFVLLYVMGVKSPAELGTGCGVSRGTIYNWMRGGEPYRTLKEALI